MRSLFPARTVLAALLSLGAVDSTSAHFLWITVDTGAERSAAGSTRIRVFLNEEPVPGGPSMIEYVADVRLRVGAHTLASTLGATAREAAWCGPLPPSIETTRDMGVRTRDGISHRLLYTARAQAGVDAATAGSGEGLCVRVVERDGKQLVEVRFGDKPAPNARIKVYPPEGEPRELQSDANGLADIGGAGEGMAPLWANWIDRTPGVVDGQEYSETRHYATLTFSPNTHDADAVSFAVMPSPAVNSFGGAVLGDWLYVYSGHVGRLHKYSVESTSKLFRRLDLRDRKTWEELPMEKDLQGVALVSDGRHLYRTGGMSAHNQPSEAGDNRSVADFARFDPESRTWTEMSPMPEARSTHDSIVMGRTLYVVGGWNMQGAGKDPAYCTNALAFDLDRPAAGWSVVAQPFKRRALAVAEAGGRLYVLGGLTDDSDVERRVDVYDPSTGAWSLGPELPGTDEKEGFGASAYTVSGRLYYSGASGYLFRLGEHGDEWEVAGRLNHPRITHRLLPGPDRTLLAVGGNENGDQQPVIERFAVTALPGADPGE